MNNADPFISTPRAARAALAVTALAVLSACAGLPAAQSVEVDNQKVAQIERTARDRGVQVMWLNYPTRVVTAAAPRQDTSAPASTAPSK
ncbi:hypothetical protein IP84_04630 [beta proteobacterium AAP99]|nr:hypothetical protein IP84_04630 [beta proteobacterium AAP99]